MRGRYPVSVDNLIEAAGRDGCNYEADDAERGLLVRDGLKWREQLILSAIKEGVRAEDTLTKRNGANALRHRTPILLWSKRKHGKS